MKKRTFHVSLQGSKRFVVLIAAFVGSLLAAILGLTLWMHTDRPQSRLTSSEPRHSKTISHCTPNHPCIAIVIDDIGRDLESLRQFQGLHPSLTFSVLPHAQYTQASLDRLNASRHEVLLHLPMRPMDRTKRTDEPWMIGVSSSHAITLEACLKQVPSAVGVNNHMGSYTSQDESALFEVLTRIGRRGLFFLDSRTTEKTKICAIAKQLHVPCLERTVFLDAAMPSSYEKFQTPSGVTQRPKAQTETTQHLTPLTAAQQNELVAQALQQALLLSRKCGWAIAIGHPHASTFEGLKQQFRSSSWPIVRLSMLYRGRF